MKSVGPVIAFASVLLVCLVFVFVWAGTDRVQFTRIAMEDDLPVAEVDSQLRATTEESKPAETVTYNVPQPTASRGLTTGGTNFVVWVNVSGFRGDYLESTETPFLDALAAKGFYTSELQPSFPSLHYPSLVSQVTGRPVRDHGIMSDKVRHSGTGQVMEYPTDLSLLKGEPIWTTAKRQGVAVLVHHWPFSQQQPPENAADLFLPEVNFTSSAEERLNAVLDAWTGYDKEPKLRLIMVNLNDLANAAKTYGTKQKETFQALEKLDKTLATFWDRVREKWPTLRSNEADRLHILVTTDHGMADVKKVINFGALMGDLAQQIDYAASGCIAQLWFKKPADGSDPKAFQETFDGELRSRIYWRTYSREDIPTSWNLTTVPQLGDRVLMLKSGYAFTDKTGSEPVFDPSESGGPFCTSGYSVTDQARMLGQAFFSTLDGLSSGNNLGKVDCTQLHPTVCELLGIEPASGVRARSLDIR